MAHRRTTDVAARPRSPGGRRGARGPGDVDRRARRRRPDASDGRSSPRSVISAVSDSSSQDDDRYAIDVDAIRDAARDAAEVEIPMDPMIGFGMTDDERHDPRSLLLGTGARTRSPSQRARRLVVLQRLALEFDVGPRYTEVRGERDPRCVPSRLVGAATRSRRRGLARPGIPWWWATSTGAAVGG